jgi:hypothetical protein
VKPFLLPLVTPFRASPPPARTNDAYRRAFNKVKRSGGDGVTTPTGRGDGNTDTRGVPDWTPLGASASNMVGPDFTPPFPSYPSGHAVTGGAAFQTLRRLYSDRVPFTFVSDEWKGITCDNEGWVRPKLPRSYSNFSQAEEEAGQSRIYLGVHYQFDKVQGIEIGRQVADYVFKRGLVRPGQ